MQKLTWDEFVSNVQEWAKERGIYDHSTPEAQLLKALSELGELSDAVIKGDKDALKDAIGDTAVCIVNYAFMAIDDFDLNDVNNHLDAVESTQEAIGFLAQTIGSLLVVDDEHSSAEAISLLINISDHSRLCFLGCCSRAWHEIKDRKGRMVSGGAFVKDEA